MPEKLSGHCATRNWDAIYVIGSTLEDPYLKVFLFNITTSIWTRLAKDSDKIENPEIPRARENFACTLSINKSKIFISGGILSETNETLSDFYSFDIKAKRWSIQPNSLKPRSGHVMTNYRNFTTIMGGLCSDGIALGSMESFKSDEQWHVLDEKLTERKNFRVTQVPTNFLPQT